MKDIVGGNEARVMFEDSQMGTDYRTLYLLTGHGHDAILAVGHEDRPRHWPDKQLAVAKVLDVHGADVTLENNCQGGKKQEKERRERESVCVCVWVIEREKEKMRKKEGRRKYV